MNVGDSILSNTYILFWQLCILVSEMAESTQREDLTTGEEFHEKTGVLGGNMSKKTERGLDLESINIDF